jgi:hypothetical protein
MGYESRVIIARPYFEGYAETIAELNLCGTSQGFLNLFTGEYEGKFFDFYGSDAEVKEDKYGKKLTYTSFEKVYNWLLDNVQVENYRRFYMLLALMQTIRTGWSDEIGDFIIIHYGY